MQFTLSALAALAAISPVFALPQPADDNGLADLPCVGTCFLDKASPEWLSNACDGTETGTEVAECTCQSIREDPFFDCMLKCPEKEQKEYVESLNGACDDLFSKSSGGDKGDDKDDDSDSKPSSTDSGAKPSGTAEAEDDDAEDNDEGNDDDEEDGAIARTAPALLAAGGLVAAFLL